MRRRAMELHELMYGELFMCDLGAHKGYLYKFVRNVYDKGDKLDYSEAVEIGQLDNGGLYLRNSSLTPSNWNPHCSVYKVQLVARRVP